MLFMYRMKMMGPMTDPCGMPLVTSFRPDVTSPTVTRCLLFSKKLRIIPTKMP